MIADGIGHGIGQTFGTGVISAHKPLQFGKFSDHFGHQVGLAQFGRKPRLHRVRAGDEGAQRLGQIGHTRDLFGERAQLFVEGDARQLGRLPGERGLEILIPEKARVRKARGEHLAVAGDDRLAAVAGRDVGSADEGVGELARAIAADEVLLVDPRGQLDHFGRDGEEFLVKPAEQRDGPFGKAGVFDDQTFVLDQIETGGGSRGLGALAHDRLALCVIDDHVRGAQGRGIGGRIGDHDRTAVMEPVPHGFAAGCDPAHFARHHFTAQQRDNPRQRAHPAQGLARQRGGAPALRLGPRERAHDRGDRFGQHLGGGAAGLFDHRKPHAVTLGQLFGGKAGLAQEPLERLRRGRRARALQFLVHGICRQRQRACDQRQTPRRRPHGDRTGLQPRGLKLFAEQAFEIGARAGLHPRGDLFRAQFEQEIGAHWLHPGKRVAQSSRYLAM